MTILNILLKNHHCRMFDTKQLSGAWFNIVMPSYQHRKSHCGDKTILRPSYLNNGISNASKMASLYWIKVLNYCWLIVTWILMNTFKWKFDQYTAIFTQENALENFICKIAIILSRHRCEWFVFLLQIQPSHSYNSISSLSWTLAIWSGFRTVLGWILIIKILGKI